MLNKFKNHQIFADFFFAEDRLGTGPDTTVVTRWHSVPHFRSRFHSTRKWERGRIGSGTIATGQRRVRRCWEAVSYPSVRVTPCILSAQSTWLKHTQYVRYLQLLSSPCVYPKNVKHTNWIESSEGIKRLSKSEVSREFSFVLTVDWNHVQAQYKHLYQNRWFRLVWTCRYSNIKHECVFHVCQGSYLDHSFD